MRTAIFAIAAVAFCSSAWSQPYAVGAVNVGLGDARAKTGFSIGGGYQFNRHFALEAAYNDLPSSEEFSASAFNPSQTQTTRTWSGKSVSLSAVGLLPISARVSLVGRASAHNVDADSKTTTVVLTPISPVDLAVTTSQSSSSKTFWAPAAALGIQYTEGRATVRAMYEQLKGDSSLTPRDLKTATFSLAWSF